jgi:multicomponent K+:H+ antiporter subunit D
LLTALVGFAGVLTGRTVREQAAYAVLGSTGTLLSAVATWRQDAVAAALYYLPHSTLAGAALFLVADAIGRRRAEYADSATPGPQFADRQAVAALFMLAAIGIVGLPPLSGFIGKLLILRSTFAAEEVAWIWGSSWEPP